MPKTILAAFLILLAVSCSAKEDREAIVILGTGNMAAALGPNLHSAGYKVIYGSRDPARQKVRDLVSATGPFSSATSQALAVREADVIILAIPWEAAEPLLPTLGEIDDKVFIDIMTAERIADDGYPELSVETSTTEMLQHWAPDAHFVAASIGAAETVRAMMQAPEPEVVYLAADNKEAKERVAQILLDLNFFPLDAGPARMSRSLAHMGLVYLTPLFQNRDVIFGASNHPRLYRVISCMDRDGWFPPVSDAENLASFPNLEVQIECEN